VEPLVAAAETAHEQVFGSKPQQIAPGYTSMWNDNNIYSELAIPSVKIGPSPKDSTGDYDYNYLGDLVSAAKIYALIALNVCGMGDVADYHD
jgi:acetylornithine deacetylase/succinyl-diaminopimelate desuccinylase-like protein